MTATKKDIISRLQKDILLRRARFVPPPRQVLRDLLALGPVEAAFPNGVFPTGAIHEFLSPEPELAAACGGFIGGLLNGLMQHGGACLWIGVGRTLFPPALKTFGR